MYRLEVEQITKRRGGETVVDNLSFTVQPGRVTGLLGPNGAGESSRATTAPANVDALLTVAKRDVAGLGKTRR